MKSIFVIIICFMGYWPKAQLPCGSDIDIQSSRVLKNFNHAFRWVKINESIDSLLALEDNKPINSRSIINIPVVFHIVWHEEKDSISNQQIYDQLDELNNTCNALNEDIIRVPMEFEGRIGNLQLKFCLAAEDSDGNPTNGINRRQTDIAEIGQTQKYFYADSGGIEVWDPERYINIWVVPNLPFSGLASFPMDEPYEKHGIIINSRYFKPDQKTQKKSIHGRILTHEIGHYFGLRHLWGDENNCDVDDGVEDTPLQSSYYAFQCPRYPQYSCGSSDMFMNYMNYVQDSCMYMFSQGQVNRMRATLELFRNGLLNSTIHCVDLKKNLGSINEEFIVYPNPTKSKLSIDFKNQIAELGLIKLYNLNGYLLFDKKLILRNEMNITLPSLKTGIYFIRIGQVTRKIIIH